MRVTADLESSIMFNNFTTADKESVLNPALIIAPGVSTKQKKRPASA